jgi:hypothetical protein
MLHVSVFIAFSVHTRNIAQRRITAAMHFGALSGRLGLRGAAARRSATWPFGLVGLRATSHNRRTLWDIASCNVRNNSTSMDYLSQSMKLLFFHLAIMNGLLSSTEKLAY